MDNKLIAYIIIVIAILVVIGFLVFVGNRTPNPGVAGNLHILFILFIIVVGVSVSILFAVWLGWGGKIFFIFVVSIGTLIAVGVGINKTLTYFDDKNREQIHQKSKAQYENVQKLLSKYKLILAKNIDNTEKTAEIFQIIDNQVKGYYPSVINGYKDIKAYHHAYICLFIDKSPKNCKTIYIRHLDTIFNKHKDKLAQNKDSLHLYLDYFIQDGIYREHDVKKLLQLIVPLKDYKLFKRVLDFIGGDFVIDDGFDQIEIIKQVILADKMFNTTHRYEALENISSANKMNSFTYCYIDKIMYINKYLRTEDEIETYLFGAFTELDNNCENKDLRLSSYRLGRGNDAYEFVCGYAKQHNLEHIIQTRQCRWHYKRQQK